MNYSDLLPIVIKGIYSLLGVDGKKRSSKLNDIVDTEVSRIESMLTVNNPTIVIKWPMEGVD